jgi:pyruvate kinase
VSPYRRTKIVATLGPASSEPARMRELIAAGVNVFRINFSHGTADVHRTNVERVRALATELGANVGILQDLQGPKIRVAKFAEGEVELEVGAPFALTCDDDSPGDASRVGVTYAGLCQDVGRGDTLLLDDGRLALQVESVQGATIRTVVTNGGVLSNNKGINIPDADLSIPALTDKDVADLEVGAQMGVDWVAMSFVRSRDDLLLARHYLSRAGSTAKLMAKIEKPSAVERFAEILREVDGVMVARGDLGVELPPERVPQIQKKLIRACLEAGVPVVTATQMLESMIWCPPRRAPRPPTWPTPSTTAPTRSCSRPRPPRATYPVEAVRMMDRIARTVEGDERYIADMRDHALTPDETTADAVSKGACDMAYALSADMIVTFSASGTTAQRVARHRPSAPVLAITPSERAFRQLSVVWGVLPHLSADIASTDEMVHVATQVLTERKVLEPGSRYVITAGVPFGTRGTTNMIRVERFRP